jgi:hypothetical protein
MRVNDEFKNNNNDPKRKREWIYKKNYLFPRLKGGPCEKKVCMYVCLCHGQKS